jgi:glycosyltransferase involved in cell wall biosynthesis
VTVSGEIPHDLRASIDAGLRPRADYVEIAAAAGGELLDRRATRAELGRLGAFLERLAGPNLAMAVACVLRRKRHGVIFTDGEQVGIPYALLSRLIRGRPRHVMIGHSLSPRKKVLIHRALRLERCVDVLVVYSSEQRRIAIESLRYPPGRVVLHPFMVDTEFWSTVHTAATERTRPLICAIGREMRDYPTLVEAVRGLDVDVRITGASSWSTREDTTSGVEIPSNVTVQRLELSELRQLYADADLTVVPLQDVDFQAGITTILEAMSMGRAIICSRVPGQTDTIVDGETGCYVSPGDPLALRTAIQRLLDAPDEAERLGSAGQRWVRAHADVLAYAADLAALTA